MHKKTTVITQSNYIPWRGYFNMLGLADEVVLLDSVQYTKRDWRNRNKIKTPQGAVWLSISVEVKGKYTQAIDEVLIADQAWSDNHRRNIAQFYRNAPCFDTHGAWIDELLSSVATEKRLTDINEIIIRSICEKLGIKTKISRCRNVMGDVAMDEMSSTERLAVIAERVGATHYISGPAAKNYMDMDVFQKKGIEVEWMDYSNYLDYPQLWGEFIPGVSVVDLILNTGDNAAQFLQLAKS